MMTLANGRLKARVLRRQGQRPGQNNQGDNGPCRDQASLGGCGRLTTRGHNSSGKLIQVY